MRKYFVLLLVVVLALSASGCGVKKKIENKIGEAIGEKIIEGASGQKVDISGDKITFKGEDGSTVTWGANEWPKSDLMKNVPQFKEGKITSSMDSEEGVMVTLEEVESKAFESYLEGIKRDFSENAYEAKSEDMVTFAAENGKKVMVYLTYDKSDGILSIVVSKVNE